MRKKTSKTITITDVAALAGVDPSTVSRVLRSDPNVRVRSQTRERIMESAKKLDYRPNLIARSLRMNKSFLLAVLISDMSRPFIPELVSGAEQAAADLGYSVVIGQTESRFGLCKSHFGMIREHRVDGLILGASELSDDTIEELVGIGTPVVFINRRPTFSNNYVIIDDVAAAKLAVDHLVDIGHRRIAHLSGPLTSDMSLRRLQGYRQSLSDHGLSYDSTLIEECGLDWPAGEIGMAQLINRVTHPIAVFATNLTVALGAMVAIRRAGLRVPEDISIVAIHDAPVAGIVSPPLTVVKTPLLEIGRRAVEVLMGIINNEASEGAPAVLPPEKLIIRGSTAPPN